jgi:hypothetical protein
MKIELRKTDTKLFLFKQEKKDGMIPFLEGLNLMSYGDKVVLFISNLAYGERGAGGVIPKRNPDFEMEMLENQQVKTIKKPSKLPLIKKPDIFFIYRVSLINEKFFTFHGH